MIWSMHGWKISIKSIVIKGVFMISRECTIDAVIRLPSMIML